MKYTDPNPNWASVPINATFEGELNPSITSIVSKRDHFPMTISSWIAKRVLFFKQLIEIRQLIKIRQVPKMISVKIQSTIT